MTYVVVATLLSVFISDNKSDVFFVLEMKRKLYDNNDNQRKNALKIKTFGQNMKIIQACRFNTFEQLEPLKEMRISELDCFGSEVATLEKYRYVENQI